MVDTSVLVFIAFIAYEVVRVSIAKYQAYRRACRIETQIKHVTNIVAELYLSYVLRVLTRKTNPLDDKIRVSINALLKEEYVSETTWRSINNWITGADADVESSPDYTPLSSTIWTFKPVTNWNENEPIIFSNAQQTEQEQEYEDNVDESNNVDEPEHPEAPTTTLTPTEKPEQTVEPPTVLEADSPEALDELVSSTNSLNNSQIFDGMNIYTAPRRRFGLKTQSQK